MIRSLSIGALCLFLFNYCSNKNSESKKEDGFDKIEVAKIESIVPAGGLFRFNETTPPGSLFPPAIVDVVASRTAAQVYEGLFKLDPQTLEPVPCLAKSWQFTNDNTSLLVELKTGVYFHDDPCFPGGQGRELEAEDIIYCFTYLASPEKNNSSIAMASGALLGAKEYYDSEKDGRYTLDFKGVKKTGKYSLVFSILGKPEDFLYFLSRPESCIFPKEAVNFYGFDVSKNMVGTGPFIHRDRTLDKHLLLEKNEKYHEYDLKGNQLPYLSGLSISYIQDKKSELLKFKGGELDMVYSLPHEYIIDILEDTYEKGASGYSHFTLQRVPEFSTEILGFNLTDPVFSNLNFRKAIAFSIDRKKIVDDVLKGQAFEAGSGGVVPPGFNKYPYSNAVGYAFNLDSAAIYLNRSGIIPDELGDLNLTIASKGNFNVAVSNEIRKQIKNALGLEVTIQIESFSKLVEEVSGGSLGFYRIGWSADFPSIMEFLSIYSEKGMPADPNKISFPNVSRYRNKKYDQWLNVAKNSIVDSITWNAYAKAERILMADCPVVVLWYDEGYRLLQPTVKNLAMNSIQYRDFRRVYFERLEPLRAN